MTLQELREARAKLWTEMQALVSATKAKEGAITTEETAQFTESFERMNTDIDALDKQIAAAEAEQSRAVLAMESLEERARQSARVGAAGLKPVDGIKPSDVRATQEYDDAFAAHLRGVPIAAQRGTLQADSELGGGFFTASQTFIDKIIVALTAVNVVQAKATVYQAGYNEDLGAPTLDADVGTFEFGAGELTAASEDTNISFGQRHLKIHPIKRKLIKISKTLLQSSRMDVEGFITGRIQLALGKSLEQKYMTGTGMLEPLGLFVASADGITSARDVSTDMTTTNITYDGLVNVQHSVRPVYQGTCEWLVSDTFIKNCRKIKITTGEPLWQPGMIAGAPNTLLGKPYTVSEYVPTTWTTGLYVGLYGDLSYYWIAMGMGDMAVQRLIEKYAETGQIGLLFERLGADAMPVLAEAFARVKLG